MIAGTDRRETRAAETAVPFYELAPSHAPVHQAILEDIARLMETGAFTGVPAVGAFEEAYASYCGAPHCVGISNGLDALRLALIASGLESGDEVLVPAGTFVATLAAVTHAAGLPVLVDIGDVA